MSNTDKENVIGGIEILNTYFFLPVNWQDNRDDNITEYFNKLKDLIQVSHDMFVAHEAGRIDLITIEVDVEALFKYKSKEEDLSLNFWLDYATGKIDIDQL